MRSGLGLALCGFVWLTGCAGNDHGSGSQLGPYASGAGNVIFVVGAQKIVPNLETGLRRIYEYSYPLEDARARQAYGFGSRVAKILIINIENPGRVSVILVKERLGF